MHACTCVCSICVCVHMCAGTNAPVNVYVHVVSNGQSWGSSSPPCFFFETGSFPESWSLDWAPKSYLSLLPHAFPQSWVIGDMIMPGCLHGWLDSELRSLWQGLLLPPGPSPQPQVLCFYFILYEYGCLPACIFMYYLCVWYMCRP